jgi:two-component system sensor histidine kinase YesM
LSFLVIILLIILILTVATMGYTNDILSQDVFDAYEISAESLSSQCDSFILQIQNGLLTHAISSDLQQQLRLFYRAENRERIAEMPLGANGIIGSQSEITVYPMAGRAIYGLDSQGFYAPQPEMQDEAWVRETLKNNGCLTFLPFAKNGARYVRFSMLITDTENWDCRLGVITADIQLDAFLIFIGKTSLGSSDFLLLIDDKNEIQYPYKMPAAINMENIYKTLDEGTYIGQNYVSIYKPVIRSDWKLLMLFSSLNIQAKSAGFRNILILIGFFSCVLCFAPALWLSYQNSVPITNLIKSMRDDSYFHKIPVPHNMNKDYKSLYVNYNQMVARIDDLVEKLYDTSKREKENELKMLYAQLNPHFLYNVLDSINWLAIKYKADDIKMMVISLGAMLRCSLNGGREILPVRQEVRQVKSYLAIQSYRNDDEIEVAYDFSDEIMDKKMIKLLLQPLVENALIHGLEAYDGPKRLMVSGRVQNGMMVFEVRNNGNKADFEHINNILYGIEQATQSYGIRNVNQRIKAAYGEAYCLSFYGSGEWTVASISVPMQPL